jgi:hypothetical protein
LEPIDKRIIGHVIDEIRRLQAHFDDHVFGVGLAAKPVVYCCFNGLICLPNRVKSLLELNLEALKDLYLGTILPSVKPWTERSVTTRSSISAA